MTVGFAPAWGPHALAGMQSELRHSLSQRLMQTHADPPTNPLQHLYSLLSTDSSVGVMGGLDTRINASPMDYPVTCPQSRDYDQ